jgi:hypothetical protein
MRKVLVGVLATVLILLVLGSLGFLWAWGNAPSATATPCERDCINDSGGKAWCADYCKKYGTYGPAKK